MAPRKSHDAPFGWDVVGEDDRRIDRGLSEQQAQQRAHQISSVTGEKIEVVAAEGPAPSVPGLSPDPDFPPIAEQLADE